MISSIYDLQNGDIVFKNTSIRDKGKSLPMRVVNEITTFFSNIHRRINGMPRMYGRDHTEFLLWNGTILETTSSVSGVGVRSMNFIKWMEREGYPQIEILRRPNQMTPQECITTQIEIVNDRGIPYGLKSAIKEVFTKGYESKSISSSELMERGIFCSESSKKYSGYPSFTGPWPDELYQFLISEGYTSVYKDGSKELIG